MGEPGIPGPPTVWKDNLSDQGTTQLYKLGTIRQSWDGDTYVYVKAGASNIAAGKFCSYITTPTSEDTAVTAHGIGTTRIKITDASSTASAFKDGYLVVNAGTGIGEVYRIIDSDASDGTYVYLDIYEGLRTAWSTSDTDISVYPCPYNGIVVNPNDGQQRPICVTQWPLTATYYGWALKSGKGSLDIEVLAAGGAELDEKLIIASTTDATNAGRGSLTGSGTSTMYGSTASGQTTDDSFTIMTGAYIGRPVLGHVLAEQDLVNDECDLVCVYL